MFNRDTQFQVNQRGLDYRLIRASDLSTRLNKIDILCITAKLNQLILLFKHRLLCEAIDLQKASKKLQINK